MSNALAIAATTTTLRNLLSTNMPKRDVLMGALNVTTAPPDLARENNPNLQLNLFLYQTAINAAWRNMDMPRTVRPGETGAPPLPLNLYYLITAYGTDDEDNTLESHRVLGSAMSVLHDHAILDRTEIRASLVGNDLADQIESLRITPWAMNLEDMSKLWTIFQTEYRISAAYEVTVALIDSRVPVRSPVPVLKRGPTDRGPEAQGSLPPTLDTVRPPRSQSAVRLGEDLRIEGSQLDSAGAKVRFAGARIDVPVELDPSSADPGALVVRIPDKIADAGALQRWAPGLYSVALIQRVTGQPTIVSNEVPIALAPQITVAPNNSMPGDIALTVTCEPRIVAGQRVLVIFGERQFDPDSIVTPSNQAAPTTVTFSIPDVAKGEYVVRLRVDGVDSIPVVYAGSPPLPAFDPAQKVVVA